MIVLTNSVTPRTTVTSMRPQAVVLLVLVCVPFMAGCNVTTMSAVDYKDDICPALSDAGDAGATGDADVYASSVDIAVESSEAFVDEYPNNEEAAVLLKFSELLNDVPPAGLEGDDLADAQSLVVQVGDICGTKP